MKKLRVALLAASLSAGALPAIGGDQTLLHIHVTNNEGKPIGNASVIVRFVPDRLVKIKHSRTSWELRTSQEGMAKIPEIPQGKVQVQVIAKNYQTFGDTFDVKEEEKTLEIVLNSPQPQYSAHGDKDPTAGPNK
ncbi:MAG TPA: hypothetical protein VKV74_10090 [Bryobacteraceae bacterium]|nr:hypothetical protein [Bryobacteraceae bacterium]